VATELVTNAVQHTRTSIRLILRIDGTAHHVAVRHGVTSHIDGQTICATIGLDSAERPDR